MKIARITGEDGKTVCVTVSNEQSGGQERFFISSKLWPALSSDVTVEIPVDERLYDRLKTASERTSALREASRAIGYGEKSVRDIERRLKGKKLPDDAIKWAVGVLEKNGYINEDESCARIAESTVATKHYGRRRVLDYLLSHGYGRESAESAVDSIPEEDYRAALEYNIEHKFPDIATYDAKDRAKATASLMRLGFSGEEIANAIRKMK